MSEERGKRDSHSEGTEDSSVSDDVAAGSEVPTSEADDTSKVDISKADNSGAGSSDAPAAAKPSGKRSTRRVREAAPTAPAAATKVASRNRDQAPKRLNIFKRLIKFFREVIAELRKVIWPNRKQMVTYTSVVLVFVTFMVAYISGLDLAFIKGVGWLFG